MAPNTVGSIERGHRTQDGKRRKVMDALGIEPVAERQARVGYPEDIESVLRVIGIYLLTKPREDRAAIADELTAWIMDRELRSRPTGK